MNEFSEKLAKLALAIESLPENPAREKKLYDFKSSKDSYLLSSLESALRSLKKSAVNAKDNEAVKNSICLLEKKYEVKDFRGMRESIARLTELSRNIDFPQASFRLGRLPADIEQEIKSDLSELERCFNSECLRSSVILCGRILETALHRKYFEVTGQDILEKNPGIGLGTLVAKLSEKKVVLDPAVLQQIHLINNVRIFSVHKKKEPFCPTKQQTHAMILYTLDIVQKLFG